MTGMLDTVIPKSDQLNADSLINGPITIKITSVTIAMGEQPVSIHYEGDDGRPYKPGKSMRRVLIQCWGADANLYVGRSLTLYRDEKVIFGGTPVGGIRISHMSHLPAAKTMALTATKAVRKPFTVQPLAAQPAAPVQHPQAEPIRLADLLEDIELAPTLDGLAHKFKEAQQLFKDDESRAKLTAAKDKRKAELTDNPKGE